jgi:two-component system, cell cycle response regulator DivK
MLKRLISPFSKLLMRGCVSRKKWPPRLASNRALECTRAASPPLSSSSPLALYQITCFGTRYLNAQNQRKPDSKSQGKLTVSNCTFQNTMAKKVLLVEDDKYLLDILATMLRFSGYDIVEATSGAEAIEKAASTRPGLILLDLNLPDMNGLDAARSIKRNKRSAHIPVIACSAFGGEERDAALRSGMVDYLQKPFSAPIVKAKVQEFVLPE